MPFKSKAQRRWMFANDPAMAERWAHETAKGARLPERVAAPKPKRRPRVKRKGGK